MSISVNQAFSNIASEKYNKENISVFFIITMFPLLFQFIDFGSFNNAKQMALILFIVVAMLSIFSLGIYYVALNNAVNERVEIFPNCIKNFWKIFFVAFKSIFFFSLSLVVLLIPIVILAVLSFLLASINLFAMMVSFVLYIIGVVAFSIIIFSVVTLYIRNLNWKALFAYRKSILFIKKAKKQFSLYALHLFLLFVILSIIAALVFLVIFVLTGAIVNPLVRESAAFSAFANFVLFSIPTLYMIYSVDLTGQFFSELRERKILSPLKKIKSQNNKSSVIEST